jgi:hypothetical protein
MTDDAFVSLLGTHCPELDGGAIFKVATEVRPPGPEHLLTAGVAQALLELHSDGVIKLHASQDATGWGLDLASPTEVPERLHHVELLAHGK